MSVKGVCYERFSYFRWNMQHERCHHRIAIVIRHQHQQSTDSDEQRKRQYEWQAPVRGQHCAPQPPPHRLSTPTNPCKPRRQILPLTPMDKHIWQPGSTWVHCDSPNQPLDIHCADFPFPHSDARDRKKKSKKKEGATFQQVIKYLSDQSQEYLHNCSLTLISNQSKSLNMERLP